MHTMRRIGDALFRLAAGALVALAFGALAANAAEHKPYSVWVVGEGEKNGHPTIVRWRDKMPDSGFKAAHPLCVEITWRFKQDASGHVPNEETERAADFDTMLEQDIESDTATGVAGFSDGEHRVWIFYANDRDKVGAALDAMKREDASLPVSYESHEDRNWDSLALVLGTVKNEP